MYANINFFSLKFLRFYASIPLALSLITSRLTWILRFMHVNLRIHFWFCLKITSTTKVQIGNKLNPWSLVSVIPLFFLKKKILYDSIIYLKNCIVDLLWPIWVYKWIIGLPYQDPTQPRDHSFCFCLSTGDSCQVDADHCGGSHWWHFSNVDPGWPWSEDLSRWTFSPKVNYWNISFVRVWWLGPYDEH